MPKTRPIYRGNPAITILRFILWLIPALFIPLGVIFCSFLGEYLRDSTSVSISFLIAVAATAGIGWFEESLSYQQKREIPAKRQGDMIVPSIVFVLFQIIVAPTVCFVALLGISAFAPLVFF